MSEGMQWRHLVVIETQKVKSYVFASPALREIRGASLLLDRINRKEIETILKSDTYNGCHEIIYLGGGSGRVLFHDFKLAAEFCREVEDKCRQLTANGRIVGEVVTRGSDESFSQWQARGLGQTHQRKTGRIEALSLVAGRWIRPCTSCGAWPAEIMVEEHGQHFLCTACRRKRIEVNKLYRDQKPRLPRNNPLKPAEQLADANSEAFIYTTLARYRENDPEIKLTLLPQDFEDIGSASKPKNYMAFIYADGNRMGETLREMIELYPKDKEAMDAQRAFSEIVDQACRQAAVTAVLRNLEKPIETSKYGVARYVPTEFIMAGGDDLMLVVPAQYALEVTADFLDLYQDISRRLQKEFIAQGELTVPFSPCGLTSSAGVVVAHAHYPVRRLMELAAELMKLAKFQAAQQPVDAQTGTLDFMVVSNTASGLIKERRKEEYRVSAKNHCMLTARPYTTDQVRLMINRIRHLKESDVPRNKLKKLYNSLFRSPLQAQYDGIGIRERLMSTNQLRPGAPLAELFEDLDSFPFRSLPADAKQQPRWQTPLTELIEFYDFIQPKKEPKHA